MKGFFEFWESSRASWADRIAVTIDLLVHLALWFVALALEIWVNTQSHKGHALLSELATPACGPSSSRSSASHRADLRDDRRWPGGGPPLPNDLRRHRRRRLRVDRLQHPLGITQVQVWPELSAQYVDAPGLDDALKIQRHMVLWAMALKFVAVVTLAKNASFWGPCVVDENQSAADQKSQYMKQMGVTSTGALASQIGGV